MREFMLWASFIASSCAVVYCAKNRLDWTAFFFAIITFCILEILGDVK
jgi:hypothetical protein